MPTVKSIDTFIELSSDLLAAYPNTTLLSITYSNESKKSKKDKVAGSVSKKNVATNRVNIKLYEPHAGKVLKFKTFKSKELSRLLSFVGPRGVNIGETHVEGLSSVMSGVPYQQIEGDEEVKEGTPAVTEEVGEFESERSPAPTTAKTTKSGKGKNKKKKKKN
ncbi:signal recognition particle 9 kDa protein-domain-containing protein [Scheffersomyces amazonensis]|uniref:signal recognition particle 9 kDa protein-domain-containing protein n=1 Tax=Scheffersomyces amazonensis TaxID=1078765 RepID=UPI00315D1094